MPPSRSALCRLLPLAVDALLDTGELRRVIGNQKPDHPARFIAGDNIPAGTRLVADRDLQMIRAYYAECILIPVDYLVVLDVEQRIQIRLLLAGQMPEPEAFGLEIRRIGQQIVLPEHPGLAELRLPVGDVPIKLNRIRHLEQILITILLQRVKPLLHEEVGAIVESCRNRQGGEIERLFLAGDQARFQAVVQAQPQQRNQQQQQGHQQKFNTQRQAHHLGRVPAVAHSVFGTNVVEIGIDLPELVPYPFDMGGDGIIRHDHIGAAHQLFMGFHVARPSG